MPDFPDLSPISRSSSEEMPDANEATTSGEQSNFQNALDADATTGDHSIESNLRGLSELGYSEGHVEEIRSVRGGFGFNERLAAIHMHHAALTEQGYTRPQIIQLGSGRGSPGTSLQHVVDMHEALSGLGYSHQAIVGIIEGDGTTRSLQAARDNHNLMARNGFTPEQVAMMLSNDDTGAGDLQHVARITPALNAQGYTNAAIAHMGRNGLVGEAGQVALDYRGPLLSQGFAHPDIVEMVGSEYGYSAVPVVADRHADLMRAGLTNHHIVDMLDVGADDEFVESVANSAHELARAGVSPNRIVEMASQAEGAQQVRDIALESGSRMPALNPARERLDVVQDRLGVEQVRNAWEALRPSSVENASQDPHLAASLSNERGLLDWALDQAGVDNQARTRLQQLATDRLAQAELPEASALDQASWQALRTRAIQSAEAGEVITPGWQERTGAASSSRTLGEGAGRNRSASEELDERPAQRARTSRGL